MGTQPAMDGWSRWMLGAWAVVVMATGVGAAWDRAETGPTGAHGSGGERVVAQSDRTAPIVDQRATEAVAPAPPALPVAVEAPRVGLSAPLVAVGQTPGGALDVPGFGTAGWYQHSVVPRREGATRETRGNGTRNVQESKRCSDSTPCTMYKLFFLFGVQSRAVRCRPDAVSKGTQRKRWPHVRNNSRIAHVQKLMYNCTFNVRNNYPCSLL